MGAMFLLAAPALVEALGFPRTFGWIAWLSPFAHHALAFHPDLTARIGGFFVYLAFAVAFFSLGYLRLRSRDV